MPVLRHLFWNVAKRVASDPRVQARAAEVYDNSVKPKAQEAWRRVKPRIAAARDEVRQAAADVDPRHDPRGFAREIKRRMTRPDDDK